VPFPQMRPQLLQPTTGDALAHSVILRVTATTASATTSGLSEVKPDDVVTTYSHMCQMMANAEDNLRERSEQHTDVRVQCTKFDSAGASAGRIAPRSTLLATLGANEANGLDGLSVGGARTAQLGAGNSEDNQGATIFDPTLYDLKGCSTADDTEITVAGISGKKVSYVPIWPAVDTSKTNGHDFLLMPRMIQAATAMLNKARHPVISSAVSMAKIALNVDDALTKEQAYAYTPLRTDALTNGTAGKLGELRRPGSSMQDDAPGFLLDGGLFQDKLVVDYDSAGKCSAPVDRFDSRKPSADGITGGTAFFGGPLFSRLTPDDERGPLKKQRTVNHSGTVKEVKSKDKFMSPLRFRTISP